jgi:AcrR family transcriptional regulator
MTSTEDVDEETDGRRARRERNVALAVQTARTMFTEENLVPTIEQVAKRSGLSLRSMYRYFADIDELLRAAIDQAMSEGRELARIDGLAEGPFAARVESFVSSRVRLYEILGSNYRATVHHASHLPPLRDALEQTRSDFRRQLEAQFEPELRRLDEPHRFLTTAACDAMCQFDSIDLLRRSRRLTVAETKTTLALALTSMLAVST